MGCRGERVWVAYPEAAATSLGEGGRDQHPHVEGDDRPVGDGVGLTLAGGGEVVLPEVEESG